MLLRMRFSPGVFSLITICCVLLSGCEQKKTSTPPEKVIIAIAKNLSPGLVKIADVKGFFREEGVDVTLQVNSSGKAALQSVLDGKAELATVADTPIMFAMIKGAMLSVLATIETSSEDVQIIASKERGIVAETDLKGDRIGVTLGTNGDYFLNSYLVLNAFSSQDVTIVDMKPEEMVEALMQGKVDAVCTWQPIIANLRRMLG